MHHDVENNEHAMKNNAAMFRSIDDPKAKGLRTSFLRQVFEVDFQSPTGLFVGRKLAYTVEKERIHRTLEKITRGLYFHHNDKQLPNDCDVRVFGEDDIANWPQNERKRLNDQFLSQLMLIQPVIIGSKQFHYRFTFASDNPEYTCWAFSFFESVPFLCMTIPNGKRRV